MNGHMSDGIRLGDGSAGCPWNCHSSHARHLRSLNVNTCRKKRISESKKEMRKGRMKLSERARKRNKTKQTKRTPNKGNQYVGVSEREGSVKVSVEVVLNPED